MNIPVHVFGGPTISFLLSSFVPLLWWVSLEGPGISRIRGIIQSREHFRHRGKRDERQPGEEKGEGFPAS